MREYFTLKPGQSPDDFTFTAYIGEDEVVLTPEKRGKLYYIEIPDIPSGALGDPVMVSLTDSENEEVNLRIISALSYAYKVLTAYKANSESSTPELVNVVKALVAYYLAADEFFGD